MDINVVVLGLMALLPDGSMLHVLLLDARVPAVVTTDGCLVPKHTPKIIFKTSDDCNPKPDYKCYPVRGLCECELDNHAVSFYGIQAGNLSEQKIREKLRDFPAMTEITRTGAQLGQGYAKSLVADVSLPVKELKSCTKGGEKFSRCAFAPLTAMRILPPHRVVAEAFLATVTTSVDTSNAKEELILKHPRQAQRKFSLDANIVVLANEMDDHVAPLRCHETEETGKHFELYFDLVGNRQPRHHFRRPVPIGCKPTDEPYPPRVCPVLALRGDPKSCGGNCDRSCDPFARLFCLLGASGPPICTMAVF